MSLGESDPNRSYIEENNYKKFREFLDVYFDKHVSFAFEGICRDFLKRENANNRLPISFTKAGTWYGYHRDEITKDRMAEEIDIVALEEKGTGIIFAECKWQNLRYRDAEKLIDSLMEKSKHVQWNGSKSKEYFAVFAKKIEGKESLRKKGFLAWDLEDY